MLATFGTASSEDCSVSRWRLRSTIIGCGQMGSTLMGSLQNWLSDFERSGKQVRNIDRCWKMLTAFDRCWQLLTDRYPKSPSVKKHEICSDPISADPIRPFPSISWLVCLPGLAACAYGTICLVWSHMPGATWYDMVLYACLVLYSTICLPGTIWYCMPMVPAWSGGVPAHLLAHLP